LGKVYVSKKDLSLISQGLIAEGLPRTKIKV